MEASDEEGEFDFLYDQVQVGGPVEESPREEEDLSFLLEPPGDNPSSSTAASAGTNSLGTGRGQGAGRRGRGRGRPRGITKILRETMAEQHEPEVGPLEPQPGSIAYARSFRKSAQSQETNLPDSVVAVVGSAGATASSAASAGSEPSSILPFLAKSLQDSLSGLDASYLQKCLANAAQCAFQETSLCDFEESLTMKLLRAPTGSNRLLASHFDVQESGFRNSAVQVASAIFESGHMLWGKLLHWLLAKIDSGDLVPLLIVRKFRYDETPLRNRVNVLDKTTGQWVQDVSDHCKLMQSEFGLRILCRTPDGNYWVWSGCFPTVLQAVERTTAFCTKQCLSNILESVPGLDFLADRFSYKIHQSTADRYAADIAAEKQLQSENMAWVKSQYFCDSHRIAQCHSTAAQLVGQDTSGMLSTALSQRDMGSLASLRAILCEIILSKLEVVYDAPPTGRAAGYRQDVFDLFLPLPTDLSRARKDTKTLVRMKQRFVLSHLLNGDLESPDIVHFCPHGCCESFEQTEKKVRRFLTWALPPHKMPKYVPSRWTGQEAAVTWCALLMCHHNLFEPLMMAFTKAPVLAASVPVLMHTAADDDNTNFFEALADQQCLIAAADSADSLSV